MLVRSTEDPVALLKRIKQQAYDDRAQHPDEKHGQRLERLAREHGYGTLAALQAAVKEATSGTL